MDPRRLPVHSRANSVVLILGVVIGLLIAGLAIPFVFGERLATTRTGDDVSLGDLGPSPDGTPLPGTSLEPSTPGSPAPGSPGSTASSGPGSAPVPSGTQPAADPTNAPRGPAPLTASDRGVTATSVKVGFTILDTANLGRAGVGIGVSIEQQEAAWRAYVQDINDRGGLNGRKIDPVFAVYDPLSEDSQRQGCLQLTQDEQVFAVVGGFNYPVAVSCVVRENQTALFSGYGSTNDGFYGDRYFTMYPKASRMMSLMVAALDKAGRLKGRTIGILNQGQNDPGGHAGAALAAALKARGYAVKRNTLLSADTGTSSSQVPVAVNEFRQDGINTVFMLAGVLTATQFVQQASNSGYTPAYHLNDWANNNNDFTVQNMPPSFEGTVGVTHIWGHGNKVPFGAENAEVKRCRSIHDKLSGRTLAARGTAEFGATMQACDSIRAFERAAKATGPNLTRKSIGAAVSSLGAFPIANWGAGRFAAGKHDFSEQLRFHVFRQSCTCWEPSGGFFTVS